MAAGPFIRDIPTYDLGGEERLDAIHEVSMRMLEEVGIEFRDPVALATWREVGADVTAERVRIPRELLMEKVALAPSTYRYHGRNPDRSVDIGGRSMGFAPVYGSPYVRTLEGERRYATLADFEDFVKLAYMSPALNLSGGTVCEPVDVPVAHRHMDMIYGHMRYSDKPFMGGVTSPERAKDCLAMCRILYGAEFLENNTVMTSLTNCNSPLVWDETMLSVIRVYAAANQACIISPFIMQGANTPITTAGAFAQLNAEGLAGVAYTQLVRPGAPVVYGATLSTVSMKTGAPMYGTSETQQLMFLTGQMARRYGLPMRTGGMRNGSKATDSLSAAESLQTMLPAILAGGNYFLHSAGWLESGLSACFSKFMLDTDQLIVLQRLAKGMTFDEDAFAFDAVKEIGPAGHFLGCTHTLQHYATAFFTPETAEQTTYEQWSDEGSHDSLARASKLVAQKLADFEAPPLGAAIDEELRGFMAKRKQELPNAME
jgi:trimethylamine--corrinoid protein Co-methyltransferase